MSTRDTANALAALDSIFGTVLSAKMHQDEVALQRDQLLAEKQYRAQQMDLEKARIKEMHDESVRTFNYNGKLQFGKNFIVDGDGYGRIAEGAVTVDEEKYWLERALPFGYNSDSGYNPKDFVMHSMHWQSKGAMLAADTDMTTAMYIDRLTKRNGIKYEDLTPDQLTAMLSELDKSPEYFSSNDIVAWRERVAETGIFNRASTISPEDRERLVGWHMLDPNENPDKVKGKEAEMRWAAMNIGARSSADYATYDDHMKSMMASAEYDRYTQTPAVQLYDSEQNLAASQAISRFYSVAYDAKGNIDPSETKFNDGIKLNKLERDKPISALIAQQIAANNYSPSQIAEFFSQDNWWEEGSDGINPMKVLEEEDPALFDIFNTIRGANLRKRGIAEEIKVSASKGMRKVVSPQLQISGFLNNTNFLELLDKRDTRAAKMYMDFVENNGELEDMLRLRIKQEENNKKKLLAAQALPK